MYYNKIFIIMILLPFFFAFQQRSVRLYSNKPILMRMKKTIANNYDFPMPTSNSRQSKPKNFAPLYKPRSDNQKTYVSHLANMSVPIVFGIGPAGCGKTLFACVRAINGLRSGDFQKIVLTRPIVPVEEEELGFLPGTLVKKMDPWTRPLMDIFLEHYPQHELDFMIGSGVIEISPLAYMRGRTFKRCFIIADEMQNSSPGQMLMLTTRIGEGSKMVITGDLKQTDRNVDNGLLDIMNKIKDYKKYSTTIDSTGIELVEMKHSDIERSPIVSKILDIYNNKNIVIADDRMIPSVPDVPFPNMNTSNLSVPLSVPNKKTNINNDAALIPLSNISPHFTNSENNKFIF
jgi:phosphate starvation-inducible protein PhoH